ncbi:hypothetical protein BGX27_002300, partial [Mortierella sp. AM989]
MKDASSESITSAFGKYYAQRYRRVQAQFDRSHLLSKVLVGQPNETVRPSVMIVGAGLSGLLLAILLEQINIPYHIFERAKELRPL